MSNQINDAAIRAQLHTDLKACWTTTNAVEEIHDDPELAQVAVTKARLPVGIIELENVSQERGEGLKWVKQVLRYRLHGIWERPTTGTMKAFQVARANELIARLMAAVTYATIGRDHLVDEISFEPVLPDPKEPVVSVTLGFEVTVIDQRYGA